MAFGNVTRKFANETWHFEKDCSTCWVKSAAFLPSRGLLTRLSSLCAENRNLWEEVPPTPTYLHSLDEALPPAPSWCRCPLPWKKSSPRHSFPSGCPRFPKIVDKPEFLIIQNKTHWPWRCCYGAQQQGLPPRLYPLDLCKQKLFAHSVYEKPLLLIKMFQTESVAIFWPKTPSDWRTLHTQPRLYLI